MAAVVECCHDENGIICPLSIAPYEVVVTVVNPKDLECSEVARRIYEGLRGEGIEALLDDRDERPGVKFKDAELVGIPYRVTSGRGAWRREGWRCSAAGEGASATWTSTRPPTPSSTAPRGAALARIIREPLPARHFLG